MFVLRRLEGFLSFQPIEYMLVLRPLDINLRKTKVILLLLFSVVLRCFYSDRRISIFVKRRSSYYCYFRSFYDACIPTVGYQFDDIDMGAAAEICRKTTNEEYSRQQIVVLRRCSFYEG